MPLRLTQPNDEQPKQPYNHYDQLMSTANHCKRKQQYIRINNLELR